MKNLFKRLVNLYDLEAYERRINNKIKHAEAENRVLEGMLIEFLERSTPIERMQEIKMYVAALKAKKTTSSASFHFIYK